MPGAPPRIPPPPRAAAPRTARTPRLCPCTALSGACAAPPGRPTAPPRAAGSSVPVHRAMHASRRIARTPGGFARAPPARTPRGSAARAALSAPRTARTPRSSAPLLCPAPARPAHLNSASRGQLRGAKPGTACVGKGPAPGGSARLGPGTIPEQNCRPLPVPPVTTSERTARTKTNGTGAPDLTELLSLSCSTSTPS